MNYRIISKRDVPQKRPGNTLAACGEACGTNIVLAPRSSVPNPCSVTSIGCAPVGVLWVGPLKLKSALLILEVECIEMHMGVPVYHDNCKFCVSVLCKKRSLKKITAFDWTVCCQSFFMTMVLKELDCMNNASRLSWTMQVVEMSSGGYTVTYGGMYTLARLMTVKSRKSSSRTTFPGLPGEKLRPTSTG